MLGEDPWIMLHRWYATGDSTVPFADGGVASTASIIMPLRFPIAAAASDSKVCEGRQPLDYSNFRNWCLMREKQTIMIVCV